MAIKADDVTYSKTAFAVIEVKGVLYFVQAELAKSVKDALTEQLIFTSADNPIVRSLTDASEFVVDVANGKVLKPQP